MGIDERPLNLAEYYAPELAFLHQQLYNVISRNIRTYVHTYEPSLWHQSYVPEISEFNDRIHDSRL